MKPQKNGDKGKGRDYEDSVLCMTEAENTRGKIDILGRIKIQIVFQISS